MTNANSGIYLGITTTEKETGIAFVSNNKVLYEILEDTEAHHNETIFLFLNNAFQSLGLSPNKLAGIGIVIGPGMFTSLRVGIACAKGLAVINNIPIKGFNTLDALVFSLPDTLINNKNVIIPTIDIRRNEIYYRIYQGKTPISEIMVSQPDQFAQKITEGAIVFGSGIISHLDLIKSCAQTNFTINNLKIPKPSAIAFHAINCISRNDYSDIETLVPIYVR